MTRQEQIDKIEREGWFKKGLTRKVSMSSTVKQPQYQKFSFENHSGGKS